MKVDILLGLQWGDEGKGKVVDFLTPEFDAICRFQGGPNAGHSLVFNKGDEEIKHVLHLIPSGVFRKNTINIIGNGVVFDPITFMKEVDKLFQMQIDIRSRLFISNRAHLILPSHRLIDAAQEEQKGKNKIGSTLKGIGPTYTDKISRQGLRMGDILSENFHEKYKALLEKHLEILSFYNFKHEIRTLENEWFEAIEKVKQYSIVNTEYLINNYLTAGKKILAEGAQGTLLDIDFGSYPFVTSSNTISAGACSGLGVAPTKIGNIYGIFKAYCTRVGSGPFPTELNDAEGEKLRKFGFEFGATTGRPRRCGWLDLPALKYSIMLNGVTSLIITKTDILDHFENFKVAVAYNINGVETTELPLELTPDIKPIYKTFKGWNSAINDIERESDLPKELLDYIKFIEDEINVPIKIISVGPGRRQTIIR